MGLLNHKKLALVYLVGTSNKAVKTQIKDNKLAA
jgi:hypothetical protein